MHKVKEFCFSVLIVDYVLIVDCALIVDFCLVARDVCEVQLQVYNPLPDELKVTQMVSRIQPICLPLTQSEKV